MPFCIGKAISEACGRFWWMLFVDRSCGGGELSARILRVMRGRSAGRSFVDLSFAGSLEECRRFQIKNGGLADGVLLVDDATPVKVVSDEVGSVVDFPGYKDENLDNVKAVSGDFSVVALGMAVESLSADVEKVGFRILAHLPAVFPVAELVEASGEESRLFTNSECGFARLLLVVAGKVTVGYKVPGDDCQKLVQYARERFFLSDAAEVPFVLDYEKMACVVAEDAWLFRTDGLPAFRTAADKMAVARIREAALFRRVFKVCASVFAVSLFVLLAFEIGTGVYTQRSEAQILQFENKIQKQKELAQVWTKLEQDKMASEAYLKHRSRVASSLGVLATHVPENVWLIHWRVSGHVHSVQGYASTSEDVSAFLSALENERNLVNVRLRTTEKTTWKRNPVVRFDLTAEDVR